MKILVACEFSGVVRDAFAKLGHDAWSCDLLPTESPGNHLQCDVLEILNDGWDLMIAHPPCTDLAVAGAAHWKRKKSDGSQQRAINFFMMLCNANIPKIAVENPPGIMTKAYRRPDQYIEPYQFGHAFKKKTGLWLKNLPPLKPIEIVMPLAYWSQPQGQAYKNRSMKLRSVGGHRSSKIRSTTFPGIAQAMAEQWGGENSP